MQNTQRQLVLDFFHMVGDENNLNALFDQMFHSTTVQTGSFGNKVGIEEVKAYYDFRQEIFSSAGLKFLKLQNYRNFVDFEVLFYDFHDRELSSKTKEIALCADISPFVKLLASTPPTGTKTELKLNGTFVFQEDKVSFFNLNGDTDRFVRQLFPKIKLPSDPPPRISSTDLIQFIQKKMDAKLTPLEIGTIAFSMGGFNFQQSSIYLQNIPETIERALTSGCQKLECLNGTHCLEKMITEGNADLFKQLCQYLIAFPSFGTRLV